jgi:hypothetical protein
LPDSGQSFCADLSEKPLTPETLCTTPDQGKAIMAKGEVYRAPTAALAASAAVAA